MQVVTREVNLVKEFGTGVLELQQAILNTVGRSLKTRPMRNMTQDEVKRRTAFCIKYAREARKELDYPLERIVDTLPGALSQFLDDVKVEPDRHQVWVPDDDN